MLGSIYNLSEERGEPDKVMEAGKISRAAENIAGM